MPAPAKDTAATDARSSGWLPEFCSGSTVFAVMVVAELVVLVMVIASADGAAPGWRRLGVMSVYVQWLALLNIVVLCSLRGVFERFGAAVGLFLVWLVGVLVTALGAAVICRMDQELALGLTVSPDETWRFIGANAAISALIAAALLRYLFVMQQWRDRVRAAAKAQVDALQARIRPHFLFNSMNTIASLIRSRPVEAEHAVEDLADLFRAALSSDAALGTLGEELDLVARYLDIEKLRLGERLRVDRDLSALPRDLPLPRLLLQPLVENAVYHGIQPRTDGGTLELRGRRDRGMIEIAVRNPLPPATHPSGNGIAVANVRARIGYHFGTRGELRVESGKDHYTAIVRIPETPVR